MGFLRHSVSLVAVCCVACSTDRGGNNGGDGFEDASVSATAPETGATTADDSSSGADSAGPKFDVQTQETEGTTGDPGECGCGNEDWSYIWIANSSESTVTKLNTRTMEEEGRFLTKGDSNGNPSRTSVSIDAKAVVVANRNAGLIKIWARDEFCDPMTNGMAGLQTSTAANDVSAWNDDDCVAWFVPFDDMSVQRPVAWTSGSLNPVTCEYDNQKIWTTTAAGGGPGQCGMDGFWVHLVDGETGAVDDSIHISEAEQSCGSLGPYGAAVDTNNDAWIYMWAKGRILHVEYDTLDYEFIQGGSYGITVDTQDRVWTGSGNPGRYDPMTQQWDYPNEIIMGNYGGGIAQDLQERMWTGTTNGVVPIDMETMVVGQYVYFPGAETQMARGVSVDIDGFIWGVLLNGNKACRVNPDDFNDIECYQGLNSAYTYSDMSGGQINNVVCNPPPEG